MHCINVSTRDKKAFVGKKIGKKYDSVELGTEEGIILLKNPNIDEYSVELQYEQELTLFIMKRKKDGVWIAHWAGEGPSMQFTLGKSEEINYKKIYETWNHFLNEKGK